MLSPHEVGASGALFAEGLPARTAARVPTGSVSFSGHETFAFRYTWLKKGVDGLAANPDIFRSERAIIDFGVGKNMVASIRHWGLATRVFQEFETMPGSRVKPLSVSDFGHRMFADPDGWDPFLEDDATLWLLHWNLATNRRRATTWYWGFNLLREQEFSRDSLAENLERQVAMWGWGKVSASTLKSDLSCFLRTYTPGRRGANSTPEDTLDCPLAGLGLIVPAEDATKRLRFNNKPKATLPPEVFCVALLSFWAARHAEQGTLSLREIVHGEAGPGRIFRLDEDTTLGYLDTLESLTNGKLRFDDTALLRQVAKYGEIDSNEILNAYYATR